MPTDRDIFEGTVSALAFGGMGIVRQERFVVFVPFTAPGDHIVYRIAHAKKNYAVGELVKVLSSSPSTVRTAPLCPYFGTCGGCQLQHLTYEAQIEHKRQAVIDALERIGGLDIDRPVSIVPSKQIWGYRRHITLNLQAQGDRFQLGYIATDKRSLLPVECCPIFVPFEDLVLKRLRGLVQRLKPHPESYGRVSLLKNNGEGYILTFHFDHVPENMDEVMTQAIKDEECWKGAVVHSQIYGEVFTHYTIDDLCFQISPEAFIQNNAEQSLNIYMELCRLVAQSPGRVLDLYCGIGISSSLLAKRGYSVLGIEGNASAIQLAQKNAANNGLGNVDFLSGDVRKLLPHTLQRHHFDCVILNPPRTGADRKIMEQLLRHRPRKIIYISCMPSTLARDLSPLCHGGYRLIDAIAFDMFPQTAHIETLIQLELSGLV